MDETKIQSTPSEMTNSDTHEVDERINDEVLPENVCDIGGYESLTFIGTDAQKVKMLADFVGYIGEVNNPATTKLNLFTKSMYAPLDSVLNEIRPVLSKHNLGITQVPMNSDKFVYVQTILLHAEGGIMAFPPFGVPESKNDAQGVISALTYARRGALNPILATQGEADDDGNETSGRKSKNANSNAVNPELAQKRAEVLKYMKEKSDEYGKDRVFEVCKNVCGSANPNSLKSVEDCDKVISMINRLKNKEDK